jgi:hypothetical protein
MASLAYERRKAVAAAWKREKCLVSAGIGTRDWTPKEQREILKKGKATGYQGHHMKSVDGHNSRAGDPNNIQFLNRKEHLKAHGGSYRNNTNGYYDYKTGEMHSFGRFKPEIQTKKLTDPLNPKQVDKLTKNRAGFFKSAGLAAYMKTSIRAHDKGYKTVRGYAAGVGGGAAASVAGSVGHIPPDVTAGHKSSVESAAHAYDERYAAKHPEAVIDFKPSSVPREIVEKNTLVLKNNPYAESKHAPRIESAQKQARDMSPRPIRKSVTAKPTTEKSHTKPASEKATAVRIATKSGESKALKAQRSGKTTASSQSKTLTQQRSKSSSSGSRGSKQSKKHGH